MQSVNLSQQLAATGPCHKSPFVHQWSYPLHDFSHDQQPLHTSEIDTNLINEMLDKAQSPKFLA